MFQLSAKPRNIFGKKLKSLRRRGELPAVLYGPKEKSRPLFLALSDFKKVWKEAGESTIIELEIGQDRKNVLIQGVALDPVKDEPVHADFYALRMDKPIRAEVSLVFKGASEAVKTGGILVKVMHEIEVECLPKDLPHQIEANISKLKTFEDQILISDLKLPSGVKTTAKPEEIIALMKQPGKEEEAAEEKPSLEQIEVIGKGGKKEEEAGEPKPTKEEKPRAKENK